MMVTDIEVEKDLLSQPEETQVQNIECPHSKVIKIEIEELSNLEGTGVEKLELSHFDDNQNPVNIVTLHPRDHIQPEDGDLELPIGDCLLEDRCLVRPAAAGTATKAADSCIDINANYILGSSGKDDRTNLDLKNQLDSVTPNEIFLEIKGKDETNEELSNEVSGMELSNGVMAVQSLVGNGTREEKLNNEETGRDSTLNKETKKDIFPDGVTRLDMLPENELKEELIDGVTGMDLLFNNEVKEELQKSELDVGQEVYMKTSKNPFIQEPNGALGDDTGTEEEQAAFMKGLENFHKERCLEFKAPRFYGEPLNCLKLWRAVIKLGGYEQGAHGFEIVMHNILCTNKYSIVKGDTNRAPNLTESSSFQRGELMQNKLAYIGLTNMNMFGSPCLRTCTTVSWTFRCFYEKALLEYEKHKMRNGELPFTDASFAEPSSAGNLAGLSQSSGSGRARRDAAARAMQGWHSQRLLGNGEVGDPIIKDKNLTSIPKREKQLKSIGVLKRKTPSTVERAVKVARVKALKPQLENMVVDIGSPADWVKINVQRTKDCFEVYALVPGLLREEVRVQSDPAGRLVISGQPEHIDSPWGITPFKKVVSLPSRIDPHQTSAVVTLHGQLFVRVPFEQSDM